MRFPIVGRLDGRAVFGLIAVISVGGAVVSPVPTGAAEDGSVVWVGAAETNIRSGAKQVLERADGSILIAGHGNLEKIQGVGLIAVTGAGEKLWQRIYGTGRGLNQPLGLSAGPAGSTLLFGSIHDPSARGGTVPWLARLDHEGIPEWERRWDGAGLYRPSAFDSAMDGSAVMAGHGERTSPWLVRLDRDGKVVWTQRMTRSGTEVTVADVGLTDDHGVLVTGSMGRDAWAARLSKKGGTLWSVRVGTAKGVERSIGIVETPDGGALMAARADSLGADAALLLVRIDARGTVLWQAALGGPGFDQPRVAAPGDRGDIWVIGGHREADAPAETATPWIIHIDADGNILADAWVTEPGIVRRFDRERPGVTALPSGGAVFAARSADISLSIRVISMDDSGRTVEAFPFFESKRSTYRRVELPVQSAGFEASPIQVDATPLASETLQVPFAHRQDWTLQGDPVRLAAASARSPRPLPDSVEKTAPEELEPAELLLAKRFKKLDRIAEDLVESKERNPYGWMKILDFYQSLDVEGQPLLGRGMEASADLMVEWLRERPDSIAARVAFSDAYVAIAWRHRGSGFGREVTAEGAMNKAAYLEKAWAALTDVYDQRPSDPHYWTRLVTLSHIWGRTPPFPDEVLASALEAAPDYLSIYLQEAHFRLPQWGGGIHGAESFAAAMTDRADNPFGEELYARIAVSLARGSERRRVFGDLGFDWIRVRDGLRLINERYPERLNHHWAAFMTVLAGDREESRRYLTAPDGGYGPDVRKIWKSESAYLEHLRWANRPTGGAWARQDPNDWPNLTVVIEPGSDPSMDAEERLGVLVDIEGESSPVLVTALERTTAPYESVEATLDLLRRPDRIGGWTLRSRSAGESAIGGLTETGARVSDNPIRDRQVVFTRVPDTADNLGAPVLQAAALEKLRGEIRVVGCTPGEPGCRQNVLPYARIISRGTGGFTIGTDRWGFESIRIGSPVLDTLGNLVGLVTDRRFEGSVSSDRDTYRLDCLGIEGLAKGGLSAAPPALDSRLAGRHQIERATLALFADRRWSDLEWLGGTVVGLRANDGSWVGQGFVDALGQVSTEPYGRRDTEWFDEVGGLIEAWAAASPADPAPMAAAVIHHLRVSPPPPKNALWSHEDAMAEREARYRTLGSIAAELTLRYPDNILVRMAALSWATTGGDQAQFLDALRGFETVAPDLAPVVAGATISYSRRARLSVEETAGVIESIRSFAGTETAACLYGLVFKNQALRDEVDPDIDFPRVVDEFEIWVDAHPGDDSSNRRLVKLLCDIGETGRAASRLEVRQCSEIRVQGSTWSPEICRECFGGEWVPQPGSTGDSPSAD